MEHLAPSLQNSFKYWLDQLANTDLPTDSGITSIKEVLRAHYLIAQYFLEEGGEGIAQVGPRGDLNLLASAVARQITGFGERRKWLTVFEVAATLFYGLIQNHPFHDANKRTAFLVALHHLKRHGFVPKAGQRKFENLAVDVADRRLNDPERHPDFKWFRKQDDPEVRYVAHFFRRYTRKVDKTRYIVTFRQFNAILKQFDCWLDEPSGNFIKVFKREKVTSGLIFKKTREQTQVVATIGFPGWKNNVSMKDINTVRKATRLTPENGVDSQVFYNGVDNLESLIPEYHGCLNRLADR